MQQIPFNLSMEELISRAKRQRAGDVITAEQINRPLDVLDQMTRGTKPPSQIHRHGRAALSVEVGVEFRLKEIGPDWLRCHSWDGGLLLEGTDDIYVAKGNDKELQVHYYDGQTIGGILYQAVNQFGNASNTVRRATSGGTTVHHVIVPKYVIDDVIRAIFFPGGLTRYSGALPIGGQLKDPAGKPILFGESTARMWGEIQT